MVSLHWWQQLILANKVLLRCWYKTMLIHTWKTAMGSVCSTMLQQVEIHPLWTTCYHLDLTLIQGAITTSLHWWVQLPLAMKVLFRCWYKKVLFHLWKTMMGPVCSTLLQQVEIHPLSTSCYHLVLTLIQQTMMVALHWWRQLILTNKVLLRCWYKTVLIHIWKTATGSVCSTLLQQVEIHRLLTSCYHLVLT